MEEDRNLKRLVGDLRRLYGGDLLSVILYGSAARGDHAGRSSDLNVLVVLRDLELDFLERAGPVAARWTRKGHPPMLFFTPALIEESRDVFPMEFLDIREAHRVLEGEDFFGNVQVVRENMRLQCEGELKGKMIQLRERFLLAHRKRKELAAILTRTFAGIMTVCRGVLRLADDSTPAANEAVIQRICQRFDLEDAPFRRVVAMKRGEPAGTLDEVRTLYKAYYRELRKLQTHVDRLLAGEQQSVSE